MHLALRHQHVGKAGMGLAQAMNHLLPRTRGMFPGRPQLALRRLGPGQGGEDVAQSGMVRTQKLRGPRHCALARLFRVGVATLTTA